MSQVQATPLPAHASHSATPESSHGMRGQRSLPTTPLRGAHVSFPTTPVAQRSNSIASASGDVTMGDTPRSRTTPASKSKSKSKSTPTTRGGKKPRKKPQRFACTGHQPCDLSFTRSEHLARHIRKHTGERPFQCHCLRKFSRLDNLRQHAQTVHQNEVIPADSLAATGARYSKVMRAANENKQVVSRARQQAHVQEQAQMQAQYGQQRGHTRNAISQPVNQMQSMYPGYEQARRPAPPQLGDPRGPHFSNYPPLDDGYQGPYTPLSNRSSGNFESAWSSGAPSPAFSYANDRYPQRRQSVTISTSVYPPHGSPYQAQGGPYQGHGSYGPQLPPIHSGTRENFGQSANMFESPTSTAPSQYSQYSRHEQSIDVETRRRTWHHRGEYNYLASGLQSVTNYPSEDQGRIIEHLPIREHNPARENDRIVLPPIQAFDEYARTGSRVAEAEYAPRPTYQPEQHYASSPAVHRDARAPTPERPAAPLLNDEARTWAEEANQELEDRARELNALDALSSLRGQGR